MNDALAATLDPRTRRSEASSERLPPAVTRAAPGTALDGAGFALLCLLTGTGPAAMRRQLAGDWDAGFMLQPRG